MPTKTLGIFVFGAVQRCDVEFLLNCFVQLLLPKLATIAVDPRCCIQYAMCVRAGSDRKRKEA
jgi:hypothetical protein